MNELQKLYDLLSREGYYTKSFEEFQQQYNGDASYRDKVYGVVSRDGFYTKTKEEFLTKYATAQPEVKKKKMVNSTSVLKRVLRMLRPHREHPMVHWPQNNLRLKTHSQEQFFLMRP
mgnify:CR=1 FL=1